MNLKQLFENRLLYLLPLIVLVFLLFALLLKIQEDRHNESPWPFTGSPLIGKEIPKFSLPSIYEGKLGINYNDFKEKYALVSVFASWCVPCLVEHPYLLELKKRKLLPIYGIAWKDDMISTQKWLETHGNPYEKVGADRTGEAVIAFGVTGAPETFLIDPWGVIAYHHVGPLNRDIIEKEIIPILE